VADPLRAALRVARAHLTDDGLRAIAHAMLDAALDELRDAPRVPARRSPAGVANDAPTDDLTAARAARNAERLLG
jgi:hypothetical protein